MSEAKRSKVLASARSVFLRYGYRRASMNDLAEAAGVSRPALYLLFKNKEEVFIGVIQRWVDETVARIEREIATIETPEAKLERAFEVWSVWPFETTRSSPEAKELLECGFDFAQLSLRRGYERFEEAIVPALACLAEGRSSEERPNPTVTAHVLASAVRGFKQTATTPDELRRLIRDLLALTLHS